MTEELPKLHILPDKCPICGDVVRNDMMVVVDPKTRIRKTGHVQFSCNYEVEIQVDSEGNAKEPTIMHECKKGKIWPVR